MDDQKTEQEQARERLLSILPHLKVAIKDAKDEMPDGQVFLGVMVRDQNGGGRVTASFDTVDFFKDLELALGYEGGEPTDEEVAKAHLLSILSGLKPG